MDKKTTNMESTENKLIAEFMSAEYTGTRVKDYDTSWDWLMPVVQKCRLDGQNLVGIDNWSEIGSALEECNIDNTYQAVVEFIKEYNADSEDDACDMLYGVDNNQ